MADYPPKYDREDLEWTPEPGEEITVFTTEFCNVLGGYLECKGIASAEQLRSRSTREFIPAHIPDDQAVSCTHWCHKSMTKV